MKFCIFHSAVLGVLFGACSLAGAEESGVGLLSVNPHRSIERTHACKIVKADDAVTADCNEPKCFSGGATVDAALASRGLKRVCKLMDASVNRGFDVTYSVNGAKYVAWTASDPEPDLSRIGLTAFEEHTPLNPMCSQMTFKEASSVSACSQLKQ
jgi:hypothetical protein